MNGMNSARKKLALVALVKKNRNFLQPPANGNLPQALNEIKAKLERIDLALSEMKEPAKEINISQQQTRTLKFPQVPVDSDAAESVKVL
ncbi:hypothetical protein CEXT_571091 [Caerostris extrusa]|uniref:Uncharacterized protein n=1 Tax=Caerostris extrusa TaxID=172846 RepID=A0AAV4RT21_CAEEX|nr:hypothetical protein CEXT_571091 [Caerostris extrusa]